ncbi:MAG: HlyD family efflux transporter periplasmic adaptor subunit [Rhodomicrobium sp.]
MLRIKLASLILLVGASAVGTALGAAGMLSYSPEPARSEQPQPAEAVWTAAAPGRIEPKGGVFKIGAPAAAIIKEVPAKINGQAKAGDLLNRLDDEELKAKLAAAKAGVAARAAERDEIEARGAALERRRAEDSLYLAERHAFGARMDLDRPISLAKTKEVSAADIENARAAVIAADQKVEVERANLKRVETKNLPAPLREEAALAAARADVAALSAELERLHIRAPVDGTVLELHAKIGETANPAAGIPLVVLGDTSRLQVRAEVEDRDFPKIYPGQAAMVQSDAFPNRKFGAKVALVPRTLAAPKLNARSQPTVTDIDVMQVTLDLDDGDPLLPGMRVDVLFKGSASPQNSAVAAAQAQ